MVAVVEEPIVQATEDVHADGVPSTNASALPITRSNSFVIIPGTYDQSMVDNCERLRGRYAVIDLIGGELEAPDYLNRDRLPEESVQRTHWDGERLAIINVGVSNNFGPPRIAMRVQRTGEFPGADFTIYFGEIGHKGVTYVVTPGENLPSNFVYPTRPLNENRRGLSAA